MKARIGPSPEYQRLMFVLQEILDVSHYMVNGDQVLHVHSRALFNTFNQLVLLVGALKLSYRKSFLLQKSQAEAWQIISLPDGFSIIDPFQNSGGIGLNPRSVKKWSEISNIFLAV